MAMGTTASPFPQVAPSRSYGKGTPAAAGGGFAARPSPASSSSEVGRLLVSANLSNFEQAIKRLGVESAADLKYVTTKDLEGMKMTVIQRRKFEELVGNTGGGGGAVLQSAAAGRGQMAQAQAQQVARQPSWPSGKGAGKTEAKPGVPKQQVSVSAANVGAAARWTPQGASANPGGALPARSHSAGPKAPSGPPPAHALRAAAPGAEDPVQQAEKRLRENGQRKWYWEEVAKLKRDYGLSERVEIALKMLDHSKLNSLLRDSGDLPRMLQHSPDKDKLIRTLVARQDKVVDQIVTQLEAKETQQKTGGTSAGNSKGDASGWREDHSRTPRGGSGGWNKKW